jgi:hypothetical protein
MSVDLITRGWLCRALQITYDEALIAEIASRVNTILELLIPR